MHKKFDVHELIQKVINMERAAAEHKNLALTVDIKDMPKYVMGDDYRVSRILINLLSNAIKFTKKGFVKLKVRGKTVDNRTILISFMVEDSGIGIPVEKQNLIYEKFMRLELSNKRHYKGLGLGLSVVKQFVDELGGQIELNSDAEGVTKSIAVLVVEDDKIAQLFMQFLLENPGIKADFAETGEKALAMAKDKKYDIIFMDMGLPDISGIEVTKAIRAGHGQSKATPIVAITAHDTEEYHHQAKEAGVNDFRKKPVTEEGIKMTLAQFKLL